MNYNVSYIAIGNPHGVIIIENMYNLIYRANSVRRILLGDGRYEDGLGRVVTSNNSSTWDGEKKVDVCWGVHMLNVRTNVNKTSFILPLTALPSKQIIPS